MTESEGQSALDLAHQFMDLIRELGKHKTPQGERLYTTLVGAVSAYRRQPDKQLAIAEFAVTLKGVEGGLAKLLLRDMKKLRDRMRSQVQQMPPGHAMSKSAAEATEGLALVVRALEGYEIAGRTQDEAKREASRALLEQARGKMAGLTF